MRGVALVGRINDDDDIHRPWMPAQDLADAKHVGLGVKSALKLDRHLSGEFCGGLFEGVEPVHDDVRLSSTAINSSPHVADPLGFHVFALLGVIFRPHDAADDALGRLEIEVDIPRVAVAARFFGRSLLDAGDHAAQQDLGLLIDAGKLLDRMRRVAAEFVRRFRPGDAT